MRILPTLDPDENDEPPGADSPITTHDIERLQAWVDSGNDRSARIDLTAREGWSLTLEASNVDGFPMRRTMSQRDMASTSDPFGWPKFSEMIDAMLSPTEPTP